MNNVYIAILRGINVSGQKLVNMSELRQVLSDTGLQDLESYIQSGNLVFKANYTIDQLSELIKEHMLIHFGFDVPTLVMPAEAMDMVIKENPFKDKDLSKLHVTFLATHPDSQLVESLPASSNADEAYQVIEKLIYVYCPDGYGRTKINNMFFERKLKTSATTRNWKTCMKLHEMAQGKI